ncbi:MAG: flagellar filament capping protein FliD, partial [Sulfurimonas sp.]|nr:flagellar filament capping protein FliD [Sulfurimonas sp.]
MAISSVGAGSGVLTQDILDKLREADDAQYVTPLELSLANEDDRKKALEVIDASMTNLIDSINALKDSTLFQERSATVTGSSVEVSAIINTDLQDFTLDVTKLATKQIEESGAFTSNTETIANGVGSMNLNIDGVDFTIDYDASTTLDDLKNLINDIAGEKIDATVVQISSGDFRLFVSSVDTGTTQNITMTDNSAQLKDTRLTTGMIDLQTGEDATFTFNGQAITRTSNNVDDLITGLTITLKEVGTSSVSVMQDNESILEKIDSFVDKYNETMTELDKMTKSSVDSETRGIFSGDSTIRSMKSYITNMITDTTSGSIFDFGFELDKEGKLSIDKDVFTEKLENDNANVQAFLAGGTFTNDDGTTVELDGAFTAFSSTIETYTKYNAILDQMKDFIKESKDTLEDRKLQMIENLDSKYQTMQKRFIAYDIMMSRLNSASSMF